MLEIHQEKLIEPKTDLVEILSSTTFLPENWVLPEEFTEKIDYLIDLIQETNKIWPSKSDKFIINTVHLFLIHLISQAKSSLRTIPETKIDLYKFDTLLNGIGDLLKQYGPHYPDTRTAPAIPIDKLLQTLRQKIARRPNIAGSNCFYSSTFKHLLAAWRNYNVLSSAQLAFTLHALGQFSSKRQLRGSRIDLNLLVLEFTTLKKKNNSEIAHWTKGLGNLGQAELLKNSISIAHINDLLKQIKLNKITTRMVVDFMVGLGRLFDSLSVKNPNLLKYERVEQMITHAIPQATSYDLAQISHHLFLILISLDVHMIPDFLMLEAILSRLENCSMRTNSLDKNIMTAKNISQIIHYMGEVIKIRPLLFSKVSQKTAQQINNLLKNLDHLVEYVLKICQSVTEEQKDIEKDQKNNQNLNAIIHSATAALHGSVLMGISQPSPASQALAEKVDFYLKKSSENSEKYPILMNQYVFYLYLTQRPKPQLPGWLINLLNQDKPKLLEHPASTQIAKFLTAKGYVIESARLSGPFLLDIYCEQLRLGIKRQHKEWHNLYMIYAMKFIEGINLIFFDIKNPKKVTEQISKLILSQSDSKSIPLTWQLYDYIASILRENVKPKLKKSKKTDTEIIQVEKYEPLPFTIEFEPEKEQKKYEPEPSGEENTTLEKLIELTTTGDLSGVRQCLRKGDLENPVSGKKDPYIRVLALLSAMQAACYVSDPVKNRAIISVAKELIKTLSLLSLITERAGLSPLILATKWKKNSPDIYECIIRKLPEKQNKIAFSKKDALRKAEENANVLTIIPEIDYYKLLCIEIEDEKVEIKKVKKARKVTFLETKGKIGWADTCNLNYLYDHVSINTLSSRAEEGHVLSQHKLALRMYFDKSFSPENNFPTILYWLRKAAEQNYAQAQFDLGILYLTGEGVEQDQKEAARLLKLAAAQDLALAQFSLGLMYFNGDYFEQNYEKSAPLFELAANQDFARAQTCLGKQYQHGFGVDKNINRAFRLYSQAAKKGDAEGQCLLGYLYTGVSPIEQNLKLAVHYYSLAAQQGWMEGQCSLAVLYEYGHGVERNLENSKKYYQLAAAQGSEFARKNLLDFVESKSEKNFDKDDRGSSQDLDAEELYHLGNKYYYGIKVNRNPDKALAFFQRSAKDGHHEAQNFLGFLFLSGAMVKKNVPEAMRFLQMAIAQGNVEAQFNLGLMYSNGEPGVPQDFKKAISLFQKAADGGSVQALESLGKIYEKGIGDEKNDEKAFGFYKSAAENKSSLALNALGRMYQTGNSVVKQDFNKAREFYSSAMFSGSIEAHHNMAILHLEGCGADQNLKEAARLLQLAASKGFVSSLFELGLMFEHGIFFKQDFQQATKYFKEAIRGGHIGAKLKLEEEAKKSSYAFFHKSHINSNIKNRDDIELYPNYLASQLPEGAFIKDGLASCPGSPTGNESDSNEEDEGYNL